MVDSSGCGSRQGEFTGAWEAWGGGRGRAPPAASPTAAAISSTLSRGILSASQPAGSAAKSCRQSQKGQSFAAAWELMWRRIRQRGVGENLQEAVEALYQADDVCAPIGQEHYIHGEHVAGAHADGRCLRRGEKVREPDIVGHSPSEGSGATHARRQPPDGDGHRGPRAYSLSF